MQINLENTASLKNLFFYFPYRMGAGGVNILFLRYALQMTEFAEYKVFVIDFADGYMAKNLENSQATILHLCEAQKIFIPDNSVFIMQSTPLWNLAPELVFSNSTSILMWNLHPFNIVPIYRYAEEPQNIYEKIRNNILKFFLLEKRKMLRRLLEVADKNDGIVFMDSENYYTTIKSNAVSLKEPYYIPVSVPASEKEVNFARQSESALNLAWIGRLADFKVPILLYTLNKIGEISKITGKKFTFHVIGDGPLKFKIINSVNQLSDSGVNIIIHGEKSLAEVDEFVLKNVDVLFAMGTSALEGAKVGKPVVLLDFSYREIKDDYIFKWLYEAQGFNLGQSIRQEHYLKNNNSLIKILDSCEKDYTLHAKKTYEYYLKNHSISVGKDKLSYAIKKTQFTYATIVKAGLTKLDFLSRCWYCLLKIKAYLTKIGAKA